MLTILVRNISAIMLLYSGVLTLGVTSLLGLTFVSAYVGATLSVVVHNVGVWSMLSLSGLYAPLEFLGCVVAAAAGLYPAFALAGRVFVGEGQIAVIGTYVGSIGTSLKVFAAGVTLIVVAAAIEATVIAMR